MNKFELYLYTNSELVIYEGKKYVSVNNFLKYLGHNTIDSLDLKIFYFNGQTHISSDDAKSLMESFYNKNNSKVIQYHKDMGFSNMEYTATAKTLNPIIGALNNFNVTLKNAKTNISTSIDSTIENSKNNVFAML